MLPVLALYVIRTDPSAAFIEETGKAILKVEEGVWEADHFADGVETTKARIVKRGRASLVTASGDGQKYEMLITPSMMLSVNHTQRRIQRSKAPEPVVGAPVESPTLPPLEEGEFKFELNTDRGLILRSNPDFTDGTIQTGDGVETLKAKVRKQDGREANLTLVRDAVTRRPKELRFGTPEHSLRVVYTFEVRKVADEELWIDPKTYVGYEEAPSSSRR